MTFLTVYLIFLHHGWNKYERNRSESTRGDGLACQGEERDRVSSEWERFVLDRVSVLRDDMCRDVHYASASS